MSNLINKKVAFYTLGCKLNFSETSTIARNLVNNGLSKVDFSDNADLYVINTCAVTREAEKKCRKVVRRILRRSPDAFVAVIGCYSQLNPIEIANISGVDIVLGNSEKFNILDYLNNLDKNAKAQIYSCDTLEMKSFIPSFSKGERTRTFLKIQDGCDYNCSYCTIPKARGQSRSDSIQNTVRLAQEIAKTDVKEIVLTGVNIGDFGRRTGETFFDLIQRLDNIEGIERIRISSIEPNLLTNEIIDFVQCSEKFVSHFHIPLQSGSNKILKLMHRRYSREMFSNRVEKIKSVLPDCCIGVDVMVGFPGETEEEFTETYNFINNLDISYLHVFTYSERKYIKGVDDDARDPVKTCSQRSKILHSLSEEKRKEFNNQFLGKIVPVLFENHQNGWLTGLTENYIRTLVPAHTSLINSIFEVKLIDHNGKYLKGELIN
ncbi:MAG: tRNA (N(6)-L-threonylcarbamoyladenosine(37)-C(2))-methylthiotransferase MtaB [Candidatus Marinimicrobia bacterium]|nr:tRNA (N(6)-L-threonylcarbamoyladenosine(37)-C(2))-methylthiotransferase MtaB [Candidatus Neomarinimicrobiota bacterium]MBL7046457.1 tRNA (N(6)-L-threonylcarbamoyladenosine(37)-C(2))-methylthiotransferase MtaB [Candidatus Neomarinimicrobiota bacterium]